ncbi:hypothetical protein [Engelhardtia mirabilis]|uniref:Helix-turn-helix domain protein n=1 Tax=Engelhardtia mirabilis TaxID=2528011 RepID=A0A518BG04_9BACT|nr:hypothetical protein Pla133_09710 [Planctomycetes bacterium Pla133]QDV00231.1 hypothetical protein Pla86_09700 [Planctomycetes bacterium Pla86]
MDLTLREAALLINVNERTLRDRLRRGDLRGSKIGGRQASDERIDGRESRRPFRPWHLTSASRVPHRGDDEPPVEGALWISFTSSPDPPSAATDSPPRTSTAL